MNLSLALGLLLLAKGARAFTTAPGSRAAAFVSRPTTTRLYGILDEIESDSYDLMSTSSPVEEDSSATDLTKAYEVLLGELVFSTNDPRVDIVNKFDLATDPEFLTWLEHDKIENSKDPEERMALKDLLEIIQDVMTRVKVNALAEERAAKEAEEAEQARMAEASADAGRALSNEDVLRRATAIDTAQSAGDQQKAKEEKKSFFEQELSPEIRLSYESVLKKVLPPYKAGDTPASIVFNYYEQFDAQFVKVLNERVDQGDSDARALLDALAVEQQKRLAAATEALKSVLALGEPMRMEGAIVKLARNGQIDEPFLLLLEANANQAKEAGAQGAAQLMAKLQQRAMEEKDKQVSSKEIRLIRQLLRTDSVQDREQLLEDAFTPKEALLVPGTAENAQKAVDGEAPEQEKPKPEVPPPEFINACKAVLLNFGNLGDYDENRGDLATRIKKIASEAEVIATRIYGQGMTIQEQQERMWKDQTTSIFDLERMEIEAERMGETAPWANPDGGDEMFNMPGFDHTGRMKIGGDSD